MTNEEIEVAVERILQLKTAEKKLEVAREGLKNAQLGFEALGEQGFRAEVMQALAFIDGKETL